MMQKDEQNAVSVNKHYIDILKQSVLSHGGEIFNDYGDGSLCFFRVQQKPYDVQLKYSNNFTTAPKVPFRVGLQLAKYFLNMEKYLVMESM